MDYRRTKRTEKGEIQNTPNTNKKEIEKSANTISPAIIRSTPNEKQTITLIWFKGNCSRNHLACVCRRLP